MAASSAPLPPAIEIAYRILSELGPLSASDLKDGLRSEGFSPSIERLAQLPDRFPDHFSLTDQGLLRIRAIEEIEATEDFDIDDRSERPDWYRPTTLRRVLVDRVAVLDIETTGLDRHRDSTWEIALVRLDGHVLRHISVQLPPGVQRPIAEPTEPEVPLEAALRQLDEELVEVDLLLGHNLLAFDKPFLESEARRAGLEPPRFPLCADSLHLSMLVDVAMPNRSLADM